MLAWCAIFIGHNVFAAAVRDLRVITIIDYVNAKLNWSSVNCAFYSFR